MTNYKASLPGYMPENKTAIPYSQFHNLLHIKIFKITKNINS